MPVRTAPVPAERVLYQTSKRLLDLAGAVFGLMFFFLLLGPVAAAIRLDSKGPVFFIQTRVGQYGRRFKFIKFRTMAVDAHVRQWELNGLNETGGPTFKLARDPRVTRVGQWLRRASLDEVPQFWNVLKGEMSLVGPRPPLLHEVGQYDAVQKIRMTVPQGMTGLWQVRGRSGLKFDQMVNLDVHYALHACFPLDLRILWLTLPTVWRGRGAV